MNEVYKTIKKRRRTEDSIWTPLNLQKNEFRLLKLLEPHRERECQEPIIYGYIANVAGNGHPSYAALSYSWGNRASTMKIVLNGKIHYITETLHKALLALLAHGETCVWVDALCIDQDDPDEKAAQVQRMATIFQQAHTVMIWLESSSPNTKRTVRFLKQVTPSAPGQEFWGHGLMEEHPHGSLVFNKDFMDFLHCEYWHRTWVVQEIAVAKKILLFSGTEQVDGTVFESLFSMDLWERLRADAGSRWTPLAFEPHEHMVHLWNIRSSFRRRQPLYLLDLLFNTRRGATSLLLDRVYAVYGLAFDQRVFIAEPDYTLRPIQLCLQMTRYFIEATDSLDIILLGHFHSKHLPSWCGPFLEFDELTCHPEELSKLTDYINGKVSRMRQGEIRSLWNTTNPSLDADERVTWKGKVMQVVGLRLGKVTSFKPPLESRAADPDGNCTVESQLLAVFDSVCRLLMIHSHLYKEDRRLSGLVHHVFKDRLKNRVPPSTSSGRNLLEEPLYGPVHSSWNSELLPREYWLNPDMSIFRLGMNLEKRICLETPWDYAVETMLKASESRGDLQLVQDADTEEIEHAIKMISELLYRDLICFLVDYEYSGLMPSTFLDSHSEVWLLNGCSMPVILKKAKSQKSDGQPRYRFVSEALIDSTNNHGRCCRVMDGEAWTTASREDFKRIDIV